MEEPRETKSSVPFSKVAFLNRTGSKPSGFFVGVVVAGLVDGAVVAGFADGDTVAGEADGLTAAVAAGCREAVPGVSVASFALDAFFTRTFNVTF